MKNLVVIEGDKDYQFDTLENLVKILLHKEYYQMTDLQKREILEMKALANSIQEKIKDKNYDITKDYVLNDEITYIYSLLKLNKLMILEKIESDYLTKYMNKVGLDGNYIIVNKFADELLEKYLERR